jgi:hypothetical protein
MAADKSVGRMVLTGSEMTKRARLSEIAGLEIRMYRDRRVEFLTMEPAKCKLSEF